MKYRKKSPVIKAFCLNKDDPPKWARLSTQLGLISVDSVGNLWVKTQNSLVEESVLIPANPGDYIVKNEEGFLEVYDPGEFLDLYEPLKEKK